MYKRRYFCLLVLIIGLTTLGKGQLVLSVQSAPAGIVQKTQLWNLVLINSGASAIRVRINLTLLDVRENQPVFAAVSQPLTIEKGVRQIKYQDIAPADYNYFSISFSRLTDAFLPVGHYRACYSVYEERPVHDAIKAEDCVEIEVSPLAPPQLLFPHDSSYSDVPWPQFSWLPPAPISLFTDLNYDMLLTEVRKDQTALTAIQENMPLYNGNRLLQPVFSYPATAMKLDTGKLYAWRIVAKNGQSYAGQSDVWTFRIGSEKKVLPKPADGIYYELKPPGSLTGIALLSDKNLGIRFYSYDQTRTGELQVLDQSGKIIKEYSRTISYGNNFWVIELDKSFANSQIYRIQIADSQGTVYSASFKVENQ